MPAVSTILNAALELAQVKSAGVDAEAEDVATALSELNDMMLEWHEEGIWLGYTVASSESDEFTAPDWSRGAVKGQLALRIAPFFDAVVTNQLFERADNALRMVRSRLLRFGQYRRPSTMPKGAGNLGYNRAYQTEHYANTWQDDIDAGTGQTLADESGVTLDHDNE